RRLPVAAAAPRHGRSVRGATRPSALMRFRRHIPPVREWKLPAFDRLGARRWGLALLGALLGGYLTAYLLLFPAPLLHGHGVVPRVLGLSLQEASDQLRKAGLQLQDGRSDAHAPGRDLGAQSGGTGDGGRQPWSTNDRGRRPAGPVAGRRPHPTRAGRSHAGDRDPTPDERREPRDSRRAEAGGRHLGRTRHGRGHRRGPEPMMSNGGGGGIRIAARVLSADLTRLAGQVEQVLAGGVDWLHVD